MADEKPQAEWMRAQEFTEEYGKVSPACYEAIAGDQFSVLRYEVMEAYARAIIAKHCPQPRSQPAANGEKHWHMYVWTKQPFFHAVAQALTVAEARELLLEEIGGGDGSCPEREAAAKWVREYQPTIFHMSNAEFSLTDSAELREQEAYVEKLQQEIKTLRAAKADRGPAEPRSEEVTLDDAAKFEQLREPRPQTNREIWEMMADFANERLARSRAGAPQQEEK